TSFSDATVSAGTTYYYKLFINSGSSSSCGTSITALPGKSVVVPPKIADNSIVIDGVVSDSAWASAPIFSYSFAEAHGESGGLDSPKVGSLRLAYDSNYFYGFYHASDKYLWADQILGGPQ